MFFYLSFLRPLPHTADATNPVSITPQIANDLRTSHLETEIDIYYTWSPSQSLLKCTASSVNSKTGKLTTWKTSSMYKILSIPLPPNAKPGQEWQLSLSCDCPNPSFVIDLGGKNFGVGPLPVISMPVYLDVRGSKGKPSRKQEQIERLYSVPSLQSGNKSTTLCIREQTSFELDKKIWDSGLGLSSWIVNLMSSTEPISNALMQQLKESLTLPEPSSLKIVELGTGTGIVSICLATVLGSRQGSHDAHIVATDLPSAMELIERNISTNKSAYSSVDLQSLILDWDEEILPQQVLGKIDLIVMADVTYNTASFPSLVRTIDKLVRSSKSPSGKAPYILLAYKQRDPAERTLWSMLCEIGITFVLVDEVRGAGSEAVEIWIWDKRNRDSSTMPESRGRS